ncbi:MAG: BlaI/MecI/CopY family transcriptional regulator [Bacteroidota bacterium]
MNELTKAEEMVMQILWRLGKGFVNDIIAEMSEPKPAYNTVSTIIRILEKKGFVGHTAFGKTFEYHPVVSKEKYTKFYLKGMVSRYFSDSFSQMVSFFSRNEDIDIAEMEKILEIMQQEIKSKKRG